MAYVTKDWGRKDNKSRSPAGLEWAQTNRQWKMTVQGNMKWLKCRTSCPSVRLIMIQKLSSDKSGGECVHHLPLISVDDEAVCLPAGTSTN